jgi:C4-dicarboxylate-binding protein DctP
MNKGFLAILSNSNIYNKSKKTGSGGVMFSRKFTQLIFVLGLILALALTGCSSSGTNTPDSSSGSNDSEETEAAEEIVIKFSHNQPVDSPEHVGAVKFKEVVEQESNESVKVEIYPASQLGSLREQVEGTQIGTIHMTMQPSAVISPFVDDIKVADLPYLWPRDKEAMFEVLDGEMGRELLDRLEAGQFHGLGFWFGGFKLFTTNDKEIHKPSDFEGVKMRTMEAPILLSQYSAWGGNPIPLAYAELYNGLQQGIVDGQENPLQTIYLNKYYEVQNTIIQSYHGAMMYVLMANKPWFDGLPADVQQIIVKAEKEGRLAARNALAEREQDYIDKIKETGVNYYELTDEEIEVFKEASIPVHEEHYNGEWQKDYLNRLYKAIEDAQK